MRGHHHGNCAITHAASRGKSYQMCHCGVHRHALPLMPLCRRPLLEKVVHDDILQRLVGHQLHGHFRILVVFVFVHSPLRRPWMHAQTHRHTGTERRAQVRADAQGARQGHSLSQSSVPMDTDTVSAAGHSLVAHRCGSPRRDTRRPRPRVPPLGRAWCSWLLATGRGDSPKNGANHGPKKKPREQKSIRNNSIL